MFSINFSTNVQDILEKATALLKQSDLSDWELNMWKFVRAFLDEQNKVFPISTSGSTGKPKQIKHTRTQLEISANATIDFFKLKKGQTALLAIPASKIGGQMMIVRSAIAGLKLCCIPLSANPFQFVPEDKKFDFAALTPMQLLNGLNDISTSKRVENIETILLGGGEVSNVLSKKIQLLKIAVFHSYGMTETASHIALKRLNGYSKQNVFQCLPAIHISTDNRGCLVIDVPHFSHEKISTNDVVKITAPNRFEWLGRSDNIINSGGLKIQPEVVEQKLYNHIADRFFIASTPDEILGQQVVLVIESDTYTEQKFNELKAILHVQLSKYECPKKIIFVPQFKETATGKIQRLQSMLNIIKQLNVE